MCSIKRLKNRQFITSLKERVSLPVFKKGSFRLLILIRAPSFVVCKHTITTRIEKGGRDPQAWITIALLIGDNSLELLLPMANKPQDLPSCGWVAPQINI